MSPRVNLAALLTVSAALVGCGETANPVAPEPDIPPVPAEATERTAPAPPSVDATAPAPPAAATHEETADSGKTAAPGSPTVIEEPAAPSETPAAIKEAPKNAGGEVEKEQPPQ